MNAKRSLITGLMVVVLVGCGASRQSGYLSGDAVKDEAQASKGAASQPGAASQQADPLAGLKQQAEAAWDKRGDVNELKKALAFYKKLVEAKAVTRETLTRLSRGYYLLAYGYSKTDEEILAAYDAGAAWGERIMGLRPEFRKKIADGVKDIDALDVAKKEDVPGIYWSYANLGKWSVKQGFTTVLKNKSKLKAFITRVTELDEQYYHGGGHRGLGAFYAKAPSFAGGDLNKALEHFQKSLKIAPNYFGTKVLMAQYYAVKKQDKKLFKKLLDDVVKADVNVLPDVIPVQKIEQRKAKELLAKMDDKFE